jgi:hypothetical protein
VSGELISNCEVDRAAGGAWWQPFPVVRERSNGHRENTCLPQKASTLLP